MAELIKFESGDNLHEVIRCLVAAVNTLGEQITVLKRPFEQTTHSMLSSNKAGKMIRKLEIVRDNGS